MTLSMIVAGLGRLEEDLVLDGVKGTGQIHHFVCNSGTVIKSSQDGIIDGHLA